MAEKGGDVTQDEHAPLAGVRSLRGTVTKRVIEQEGVTGLQVDIDGVFDDVARLLRDPPARFCLGCRKSDLWLPGTTTAAPSPAPTSVKDAQE